MFCVIIVPMETVFLIFMIQMETETAFNAYIARAAVGIHGLRVPRAGSVLTV